MAAAPAPPGKELIVSHYSHPIRTISDRPDLDQLKTQARELLAAFRAGEPGARAEVAAHYRDAEPATFALHHAQLALARAYGFESWPKLKAFVNGAMVRRLIDAVRAGRFEDVLPMLDVRPELARMSADNLHVIHHAVLARSPEMVHLLNGARRRRP
jgi:hypothetical protein